MSSLIDHEEHFAWLGTAGLLIEIDLGSRAWIQIRDRRIDGHQAQPLPIPGSTLHDSTTPPPPPPSGPSGPTIQQDYIVPPPPPPPVQSAPQAGAFVLHEDEITTCFDRIMGWDGYDDMPSNFAVEFACTTLKDTRDRVPRIHLRLYNTLIGSSRWGCNYGDACFPNRLLPKAISSSFQLQIMHGLKRWILDFKSFKMTAAAVLIASFHFACFSSLLLFACARVST
ncbi:hypothetical protein AAG906_008054 [Vitis piasezkii]